ncbi:hypothetical protein ACHAXT_001039 [Thalassiosira profunda]
MAPNKPDLVSRDYTIHLAKRTHKTTFKSKTPKAVKVVKDFASKGHEDQGRPAGHQGQQVPVVAGRAEPPEAHSGPAQPKRNEDEDAAEKLYTYVQLVEVSSFKGLQTENVDSA